MADRKAALLAVLVALLCACAPGTQAAEPLPPSPAKGLHVTDGRLIDSNGNDVVLRGINWGHNWFPAESPKAFSDMAATGANSVRIVFSGGRFVRSTVADVAQVILRCRQLELLCVLENHDTTSYGDDRAAYTLSQAADFWIEMKPALLGQEAYAVVNIGNEPFGTTLRSRWTRDTIAAVQKLRDAGLRHLLMVDAPDFGQDSSGTMRDNAPAVLRADPDRNVIFDVHMYNVYGERAAIRSYVDSFVRRKLPLVIGEFGGNSPYGDVDEQGVMAEAQRQRLGWLAWSWSGNDMTYLDMVLGFDPARLTPWGRAVISSPNGIARTSKKASVYDGPVRP